MKANVANVKVTNARCQVTRRTSSNRLFVAGINVSLGAVGYHNPQVSRFGVD